MKNFYKQKISMSFLAITAILLSSCASMTSFQTARTTDKGKFGYGFGGGSVSSSLAIKDVDTINISAPFLEFSGRYGISDKLDIGAKLTLIGTSVLDAKYQFLGDKKSKFASSAGFGLGYISITGDDIKSNIFDIIVPMYFSYHPTDWLAIYANPKYVLRLNSYSGDNESGSSNSNWYGLTSGLRFGKRVGFLVEYSYFANNQFSQPFNQVAVGIAIGIK